jgi:hypothetical protein
MKKVLAICLMMVMLLGLTVNVFAAPDDFVKSPSGNRPPILIGFQPVDDDCTSILLITPFGDRQELPEAILRILEEAYKAILECEDLANLNADLSKYASDHNIDSSKLAISDLFNLHTQGCDDHANHNQFNIELNADTLNRFVGLMYMDEDGNWQWVKDAKVNGNRLQFTAVATAPYAIIVDTTEGTPSKTGDSEIILLCAAVMAVSAIALAVVFTKGKKKHV